MRHIKTILLLFTAFITFAQKADHQVAHNGEALFLDSYSSRISLKEVSDEGVKSAIIQTADFDEEVTLSLVHKKQSKAFTHYHFDILLNDKVIFANKIHAALNSEGVLRIQNIPTIPELIEGDFPSSAQAIKIQNQYGAEQIVKVKEVLTLKSQDILRKALLVELEGPETLHRNILIADGEVIFDQDLHKHFSGPNDTIVSVTVFEPDPLTSAQVAYGAPYSDADDANTLQLEAELKLRNTTMIYKNGKFRAENDFVKISDFSLPGIQPVTSNSPNLYFTRDSASFEDVNVVYHITNHREHITALGYPNLPSYQIEIDPHALSGSDQSFFSTGSSPYRLYLGEGGVDDGEDADVIIHEFTHAVIYEAAPSANVSIERGCIEEALCDYFAASYSASVSNYNTNRVFNWDAGDGAIWSGRSVASTKNYGALSFKNGNYYTNTDILASCLMTINTELGRAMSDEIVIEALFNLTGNTTMPDFAGFMLLADSALYGGIHSSLIYTAFLERNIVPNISISEHAINREAAKIYNTSGFAQGQSLYVQSEEYLSAYTIYNISGQVVSQLTLDKVKEFEISGAALKPGTYILSIQGDSSQIQNFKLIRY